MQLRETVVTQNQWTCEDMASQELCFSSVGGNTQGFKLKDRVDVFLLGLGCYVMFSPFWTLPC